MESVHTERAHLELQFGLWLLANAVGFGIGWILLLLLFFAPENWGFPANPLVSMLPSLGWALIGLTLGTAQWLALQQILKVNWWVIANIIGWVCGWVFVTAFGSYISLSFGWPNFFIAAAVVVGLLQWTLLRRHVHHAAVWILASAVGWGAGGIALFAPDSLRMGMVGVLPWPGPDALAAGIWSGLLTGFVLVWTRSHVQQATVGVLTSIAGGSAGFILLFALESLLIGSDSIYIVASLATLLWDGLGGVVAGTVSGLITGVVLIWLLGHPAANE